MRVFVCCALPFVAACATARLGGPWSGCLKPECAELWEGVKPLDPKGDEDKDGIKNQADMAPLIAEDKDGFQDDDGIPDPDEKRLVIKEELHFDEGAAELDIKRSDKAIAALQKRLTDEPIRIEIRGHTDGVGNPESNRKLSQSRAEAVRSHLMKNGIDGTRLVAVG